MCVTLVRMKKNVRKADCLIIDCFGLLSSIYRYGEIAYIGGGFGVGIHNTLEAAAIWNSGNLRTEISEVPRGYPAFGGEGRLLHQEL